jgi:hypothetical protein
VFCGNCTTEVPLMTHSQSRQKVARPPDISHDSRLGTGRRASRALLWPGRGHCEGARVVGVIVQEGCNSIRHSLKRPAQPAHNNSINQLFRTVALVFFGALSHVNAFKALRWPTLYSSHQTSSLGFFWMWKLSTLSIVPSRLPGGLVYQS